MEGQKVVPEQGLRPAVGRRRQDRRTAPRRRARAHRQYATGAHGVDIVRGQDKNRRTAVERALLNAIVRRQEVRTRHEHGARTVRRRRPGVGAAERRRRRRRWAGKGRERVAAAVALVVGGVAAARSGSPSWRPLVVPFRALISARFSQQQRARALARTDAARSTGPRGAAAPERWRAVTRHTQAVHRRPGRGRAIIPSRRAPEPPGPRRCAARAFAPARTHARVRHAVYRRGAHRLRPPGRAERAP